MLKGPNKRIDKLKSELEALRQGPMTDFALTRQQEILNLLENLFEQEEITWLQRGRANWLRQGDRNTKNFHHFASQRKKRNMIKRLINDNGDVIEGNVDLSNFIGGYFGGLFTSDTGTLIKYALLILKKL